jgi:hypothetical protein
MIPVSAGSTTLIVCNLDHVTEHQQVDLEISAFLSQSEKRFNLTEE